MEAITVDCSGVNAYRSPVFVLIAAALNLALAMGEPFREIRWIVIHFEQASCRSPDCDKS